ncbi:SDR family NAD(P)-dependent oxidoreductase [Gordonia jinghuaiqii]|uniref:SDR family NAD(P)-dependent oxidoreductase n=1 Tax=Gordonia jinghuaiqii TaxID=2758710 RepID=A0A7D7LZ62_9ACTN|nr:SDR family NAD(P)-dependent oxidoreductase [Gordonia jinghuaiqii]MCR5976702.1 SDR family NAD(P)-dependent oxidoreductase [Gordonia jinghuaiqii]QMT03895.1 SDR family NAD(P)-dependent oxidoreductase [Gordonia jinghuaiqii]
MQRRTLLPQAISDAIAGEGRSTAGLTVVVTGASAGIGRESVRQLASRSAHVIAVARRQDELQELAAETGCDYELCDLSDENSTAELVHKLQDLPVDVLVNNAGHSIRRTILDSADRLHDYQRTIRLNYLAPVQLSLGLLPNMVDRGSGHIVNVCTWGIMANTFPRFSAYAASKSALAIFGRSLNAENPHPQVRATNVYFPLVRTEMIAPTAQYDTAPALSVDEAGRWIVRAITHRPTSVAPAALRTVLPIIDYLAPTAADKTIASIT